MVAFAKNAPWGVVSVKRGRQRPQPLEGIGMKVERRLLDALPMRRRQSTPSNLELIGTRQALDT
ncbi:hypothetical protein [Trinickia mobilis]|uniref:hypothetical protein n=1 Tax=Trinickia mobilis TaxID=2816356 RepID=UPI001A8CC0B1|nr:hypothetical protein [Trinickia mobilis]